MKHKIKALMEILPLLAPGIEGLAKKRAINPMQAEDMTQDALTAVVSAFPRYSSKPKSDQIRLLGAVARNAIIDAQRKSILDGQYTVIADLQEEEIVASNTPTPEDETRAAEVLSEIESNLSPGALRLLREKLNPSTRTERIVRDQEAKRDENRARGLFQSSQIGLTLEVFSISLRWPIERVREADREIRTVTLEVFRRS